MNEEIKKEFDEKFFHEESQYTHLPCEYLLNNDDGKCNCQIGEIKKWIDQKLKEQYLQGAKDMREAVEDAICDDQSWTLANRKAQQFIESLEDKPQ